MTKYTCDCVRACMRACTLYWCTSVQVYIHLEDTLCKVFKSQLISRAIKLSYCCCVCTCMRMYVCRQGCKLNGCVRVVPRLWHTNGIDVRRRLTQCKQFGWIFFPKIYVHNTYTDIAGYLHSKDVTHKFKMYFQKKKKRKERRKEHPCRHTRFYFLANRIEILESVMQQYGRKILTFYLIVKMDLWCWCQAHWMLVEGWQFLSSERNDGLYQIVLLRQALRCTHWICSNSFSASLCFFLFLFISHYSRMNKIDLHNMSNHRFWTKKGRRFEKFYFILCTQRARNGMTAIYR